MESYLVAETQNTTVCRGAMKSTIEDGRIGSMIRGVYARTSEASYKGTKIFNRLDYMFYETCLVFRELDRVIL